MSDWGELFVMNLFYRVECDNVRNNLAREIIREFTVRIHGSRELYYSPLRRALNITYAHSFAFVISLSVKYVIFLLVTTNFIHKPFAAGACSLNSIHNQNHPQLKFLVLVDVQSCQPAYFSFLKARNLQLDIECFSCYSINFTRFTS